MFAWFCYCMSSWIVYLLWFQSHQDLPPPPIPRRVSLELFIYYFICFVCNVVSNISSSGTSFLKEPPYTTFIQLYNPTTLLQCYNRSTSLQPFYNSTLAVNISWISTPFLIKLPCHIIKLPCRTSRLAVLRDLPYFETCHSRVDRTCICVNSCLLFLAERIACFYAKFCFSSSQTKINESKFNVF